MTLRKEAEKEAAVAILDFETSRDPAPDGLLKSCIADAIERVARAYGAGIAHNCARTFYQMTLDGTSTTNQISDALHAIAAAERDE